jgi:hypothetical protein
MDRVRHFVDAQHHAAPSKSGTRDQIHMVTVDLQVVSATAVAVVLKLAKITPSDLRAQSWAQQGSTFGVSTVV